MQNHPDNEKEWLYLIASGDEHAFEQLYRHYRNKAYSVALTYMSSPALAEDVLQDLFLKLWQKRETLLEIEHFDQYLFIVLRNMLISALRKSDRQEKIIEHIRQAAVLQPTPGQLAEAGDLQQTVTHALGQLPEKQRQIYRMSREEGLSHEEIGAIMELSPRTVSNIITLVLNHLRSALKESGYLAETVTAAILFFS